MIESIFLGELFDVSFSKTLIWIVNNGRYDPQENLCLIGHLLRHMISIG